MQLEGSPPGLNEAVAGLYAYAADPTSEPSIALPAGLTEFLADLVPRTGEIVVSGEVATGEILETQVAVVTSDADVVLAVSDTGSEWRLVGAKLDRFEKAAWFGDGPRHALVIGSDARPGQNPLGYRADSIHLVYHGIKLVFQAQKRDRDEAAFF